MPDNNGRVGMLGISYPGWLTAVAMLDPHPALKAASPQASPADMFLGDDFHHNGAFRLSYGFEYVAMMETDKTNASFKFDTHDTYEWYLKLGALSNVNRKHFKGKMPTWNDFVAHPNYDDFWKKQSLEPRLTKVTVPTLNVAGWYDQEDFRGPLQIYELLETARQEEPELPGRRPVEPRRLGGRPGRQARPRAVRLRHRAALPPAGAGAVLRPLPEGQGNAPRRRGPDVPDRRNKWEITTTPGRRRTPSHASSTSTRTASSRSTRRPTREQRSTSTSPTPPTRCRTARGRSARRTPARSGRCGWWRTSGSRTPPGRADLRDGAADRRTWPWPGR